MQEPLLSSSSSPEMRRCRFLSLIVGVRIVPFHISASTLSSLATISLELERTPVKQGSQALKTENHDVREEPPPIRPIPVTVAMLDTVDD